MGSLYPTAFTKTNRKNSWSDSQLKAFADKHGIPVPQPHKRDTLLQKIRANYATVSQKAGEAAAYPGNWLYETWSESGKLSCLFDCTYH
jgi:hypothetical protein